MVTEVGGKHLFYFGFIKNAFQVKICSILLLYNFLIFLAIILCAIGLAPVLNSNAQCGAAITLRQRYSVHLLQNTHDGSTSNDDACIMLILMGRGRGYCDAYAAKNLYDFSDCYACQPTGRST